jgi:beta-glucosidase
MLGPWAGAGRGDEAVGVLGGLRDLWPQVAVDFAPGVPIEGGADAGIAAAVAAARRADQVVLCLGEAAWMSGEAASRARLDLPGRQAELAAAVLAVGRPTVVLLFSGRPIAMPEVFAAADAVVACWFPGSEAGHAVADLISGRISPSARLPVTWPRHVGQVPIFFGARSGGRPEAAGNKYTSKYLDLPNAPQFPFGHGLGYGRLTLGAPDVVATEDGLAVTAEVSNRGLRADAGPVFLFVHDPVASIARPTLELRGLARVALGPGRRTQVAFRLARADLGFLDADLRPTFEPGAFVISVGLSADPEALRSVEVRLD